MLSFNDIFKSRFLESMNALSLVDAVIALTISLALGLFIMLIYKKTFKGVMYSKSFSVSILVMTIVTTLIILAITSNVILSLGMVGALSIVRFRSAIKEPIDIAYLFWSICIGIVTGAGFIPLAVVGTLFIGTIIYVAMNVNITEKPYILLVNLTDSTEEEAILSCIKKYVKHLEVKSKNQSSLGIEVTYQVRLKDQGNFIQALEAFATIKDTSLISYNGEYL